MKLKKGIDYLDIPDGSSLFELFDILKKEQKVFIDVFNDPTVKIFLNLKEITNMNMSLKDGDEVALLPPVTGG